MDTVELRINRTVETLKATRGAAWLLEQLQNLVIKDTELEPVAQDVQIPSVASCTSAEDQYQQERAEWRTMSQRAMQRAYDDDEYDYSDVKLEWVNPRYAKP